jgi:hypothetical protein
VRNDENMPLDTLPAKTIHSRNKSSPALSTAAANQIKAGTKRTAFGDVSNIIHQTRPSKDDSLLPTKSAVQITSKPVPAVDRKAAPLTRPPQRPMSVSNLKNFLTGGSYNTSQDIIPKSTNVDTTIQPQHVNSRRVLTKRNTTVFRDTQNVLSAVAEVEPHRPARAVQACNPSIKHQVQLEPPAAASTSLPPPLVDPEPVSEPTKEDSIQLISEGSLPGIEAVSLESAVLSPSPAKEIAGDPVKICDNCVVHPAPRDIIAPESNAVEGIVKVLDNDSAAGVPIVPSEPGTEPMVDLKDIYIPNFDEYQYEQEESLVEEDGYVTARSFRSKSENTTGGVTTVLFPQFTARIRRELKQASDYVEATRSPEEAEDEQYDTSMVAEYGEEIFEYMREKEIKMLPNAHYMDNQHEIQWTMRAVLMDWLIQVHHRFNLLPETLYLCVNYIDRFLSCKVVSLGKLQLVGATAIFIAAKYEEINCPSIQEIVYMVDNGYSIDEILKAERFMLTMLQFELGWPGPMSFLRRISKADDYDLETRTLAKYFLEITIMDERFIGSPPSFVAAASHCLARLMLRKGGWVS